jgi:hypothetical protein
MSPALAPAFEIAQSEQIFPANIYHCIGAQLMHNINVLSAQNSVLQFRFCAAQTPIVAHNQAVTGSIATLSRNEAEDLAAL